MVVALKPLHDAGTIKRVVVSTYQAVSGTGAEGHRGKLENQTRRLMSGMEANAEVYPHQIAFKLSAAHRRVFWKTTTRAKK